MQRWPVWVFPVVVVVSMPNAYAEGALDRVEDVIAPSKPKRGLFTGVTPLDKIHDGWGRTLTDLGTITAHRVHC